MAAGWSDEQARWVFRRAATLTSRGAEPVAGLVLPTPEFFPDRLDGTIESVELLLSRMKEHTGLDFIETELFVAASEEEGGGCSTGACGVKPGASQTGMKRLEARADGSYALTLASAEVRHPAVLSATLAKTLGALFLREGDLVKLFARSERDAAADLAAVFLGLGLIVLNGSAIESKGCGGVRIHSATTLSVGEAALALALYAHVRHEPTGFARYVSPVPRDSLGPALDFVEVNADVAEAVEKNPSSVEDDVFTLRAQKGWLARTFGFKKKRTASDELADLERDLTLAAASHGSIRASGAKDPARAARLREIAALVDESLESR